MNINIKESDYKDLIKICTDSKLEQNGLIRLSIDGDEINFLDVTESNGEEIVYRTPKSIKYKVDDLIKYQMHTTLLFDPKKEIWVNYHTHPGFLALNKPSNKDIDLFKYMTYLREIAYKDALFIEPPIQIEAIITEDEVGFYSIVNDEVIKHNVIIDDKELKVEMNEAKILLKRIKKRLY